MPTSIHPQAKFDPIPPDLDLHALVQDTPNFEWATQISASEIFALGQQRFEKLVSIHVINGGKPLVIKDWDDRLPKNLFSSQWLEDTYNRKEERIWDINGKANIPMTMGHYLRSMKQLTNQWTPRNFRDERYQRLYLKDMDCPPEWHEKLTKVLPRSIFYLNEDIEGGHSGGRYGLTDDDGDMFVDDHPTARAGDLMSSLPPEMRAENLMCYIGHEGTYTPAHREMCASLGQNIMVEASGSENGEKPGSSIWFMTETKDREVIGEYFLSMLGHDVEIEKHFAQINAWKKAAFPVYIVEQKLGDLILVPPLAPHQVWNRGTRTMKVAWNRTVVETLELALHEALPKARLVCRDEQYKNKAIIYYTMKKYYKELEYAQTDRQLISFGISQGLVRNPVRTSQVADDFKKLMGLYTEIVVDEMFNTKEKSIEYIPFDSNITCSYCRSNIFNRFLTCKHCVRKLADGDEDTYDVCMECYAMGRSCMCVSGLGWCEQWPWEELVGNYDRWQAMVVSNDGFIDAFSSPPPLEVAKLRTGKKPVAQICQEQLRRRPFRDITKPAVEEILEPSEPEVDDDGKVVKKKAKKRTTKKGDTYRCHVCCHKDHRYRLAFCTTPGCVEAYCYGVLYRGFDMMPQSVMQTEYWKCPRCMKICNCGACRRSGITNPYVPKGTLLGHDTRPIADDRSVESLINFRLHNLMWLKNCGEEGRSIASKRMQRLRQEADAAKAQEGDESLDSSFADMQNGSQGGSLMGNGFGGDAAASTDAPGAHDHATTAAAGSSGAHPSHNVSADGGVHPSLLQNRSARSYPDLVDDYPDPSASMLINELEAATFGRAYYMDDDDSPNKILFDPYHEPAPNAMVGNLGSLETLPEFLESYTHKPIRRPRQERDLDPDYPGPKHKRKSAARLATDVADPNMNLDPALLAVNNPPPQTHPAATSNVSTFIGESEQLDISADAGSGSHGLTETTGATVATTPVTSSIATALAATITDTSAQLDGTVRLEAEARAENGGDEEDNADKPTYGYPANVPELRHARPMVSYLVDVGSGDEGDDDANAENAGAQKAGTAVADPEKVVEPVEIEQPAGNAASTSPSPVFPEFSHRSMSTGATPKTADAASDNTPQPEPHRKRGRPPRSSMSGLSGLLSGGLAEGSAATPPSEPPTKRSRTSGSLSFGSATKSGKASEALGSVWKPVNSHVGRPPKRSSLAVGDDGGDDDDNDEDNLATATLGGGQPKRKPGRPPKSQSRPSLHSELPSTPSLLPPPTTKFMSMAERMALKGKKFKIGSGKPKAPGNGGSGGDGAKKKGGKEGSASSAMNSPSAVATPTASVVVEPLSKPRSEMLQAAEPEKRSTAQPTQPGPARTRRYSSPSAEKSDDEAPLPKPPLSSLNSRGALSRRGRGGRGRIRPPGPVRDKAPTVVRLMDSDSEDGGYNGVGASNGSGSGSGSDEAEHRGGGKSSQRRGERGNSNDSDGSDSGTSTGHKTYFARRGGGPRGRGRGRGGPRGRPVGIAR